MPENNRIDTTLVQRFLERANARGDDYIRKGQLIEFMQRPDGPILDPNRVIAVTRLPASVRGTAQAICFNPSRPNEIFVQMKYGNSYTVAMMVAHDECGFSPNVRIIPFPNEFLPVKLMSYEDRMRFLVAQLPDHLDLYQYNGFVDDDAQVEIVKSYSRPGDVIRGTVTPSGCVVEWRDKEGRETLNVDGHFIRDVDMKNGGRLRLFASQYKGLLAILLVDTSNTQDNFNHRVACSIVSLSDYSVVRETDTVQSFWTLENVHSIRLFDEETVDIVKSDGGVFSINVRIDSRSSPASIGGYHGCGHPGFYEHGAEVLSDGRAVFAGKYESNQYECWWIERKNSINGQKWSREPAFDCVSPLLAGKRYYAALGQFLYLMQIP